MKMHLQEEKVKNSGKLLAKVGSNVVRRVNMKMSVDTIVHLHVLP